MNVQVQEDVGGPLPTIIKVIGCGGAGTNAVNWMCQCGLGGVHFIAANTDAQSLNASLAELKLAIGTKTTRGLGAGSDPKKGETAAMEDREMIENAVRGSNMVFVMAGMGGGTGTGAAPIVAQIAKECGALTVGVVTKPFDFEGARKMRVADEGIMNLRESVDTLIVIPNQHLVKLSDRSMGFRQAYHKADDVLRSAVQSITDLITTSGYQNVDFADVTTAMCEQGDALMGIGVGTGEKRAMDAAVMAMNNPLLEDTSITGAQYIIVNITCGTEEHDEISIPEIDEIINKIKADADEDVWLKHGIVLDPSMGHDIRVTLIATGFRRNVKRLPIAGQTGEVAGKKEAKPDPLFATAEEWDNIIASSKSLHKGQPSGAPQSFGSPAGSLHAGLQIDVSDIDMPAVLRERKLRVAENGLANAAYAQVDNGYYRPARRA